MGLVAFIAWVALGAAAPDPVPSPAESADLTVTLPPALPARPSLEPVPAAQEPAKAAPPLAIPVEETRRVSRPLEEKAEAGPSVGGFVVGSFAVVGCLGGAFLLLRRFGKNSRFLGGGNAIRVLARKPLGARKS